jgi:hypothetical protein
VERSFRARCRHKKSNYIRILHITPGTAVLSLLLAARFLKRVFSAGKRAMIGALVASVDVKAYLTCFRMEEFES